MEFSGCDNHSGCKQNPEPQGGLGFFWCIIKYDIAQNTIIYYNVVGS